jgi:hypothetical protein
MSAFDPKRNSVAVQNVSSKRECALVKWLEQPQNQTAPRAPLTFISKKSLGLAAALVLDAGGQTDHKLSSRLESVDFEGAAKLADS